MSLKTAFNPFRYSPTDSVTVLDIQDGQLNNKWETKDIDVPPGGSLLIAHSGAAFAVQRIDDQGVIVEVLLYPAWMLVSSSRT